MSPQKTCSFWEGGTLVAWINLVVLHFVPPPQLPNAHLRLSMKSMTPQQKAKQSFEAQRKVEDLTEAETEELEVRKRRAEGTPVNKETFERWKEKFEAEMREQREREEEEAAGDGKKKKENKKG